MSKKMFVLISSVVGGIQTIAVGVVTYLAPENATAINGCIVLVGTCIIDCCTKFITENEDKKVIGQ